MLWEKVVLPFRMCPDRVNVKAGGVKYQSPGENTKCSTYNTFDWVKWVLPPAYSIQLN